MNIQSTHINRARGASKPPAQQQEQLQQRIKSEAQDAFVNSNSGFSRVGYGMLSGATGSVAGAVAGTAVVAGIAQIADAVIPGNAFPVGILGPVLGVSAAAFATISAIDGGVAGYKGEAGAHTNALTTRSAFRDSASLHASAAGALMGSAATTGLAQAFFPQHTLVGAVAGLALGALAGHRVGKTVAAFGGNLATIPMKKAAGMEGSQYSGKLRAEAPDKQAHTTSKLTPIFDDKPMTADVMKTLSEAKESIRFETYLLNGEDGKALCDMLIKKKNEGLDVKVILDPFFQKFESKKRAKGDENYALGTYLKENGVDYVPYSTSKLTGSLTPSEHAKILVVDDKIAYMGGTNIDDTNNQDTNVKIEGPAAKDIAKLFDESWAVSNNDDPAALGLHGDPTISDPNIKVFSTGPSRSTIKQAVIDNIREAKKSIQIQMFTLTDDDLVEELQGAAERGVDVQLLLCDNKEIFHLPTFHVPNLPTALQAKKSGINVKWYVNPEFTQMHSKLMVFDGEKTMLGSMNGIHNAFRGIHEYYSEINDKDLATQMSTKFQDDWNNRSEEVTSNLGYRALGAVVEGLDGTVF